MKTAIYARVSTDEQTADKLNPFEYWIPVKDGDSRALGLMKRHYSWHEYKDKRNHRLFVGPGEKVVLLSPSCLALFVWKKFIDKSGQQGVNCSVFRNESAALSSTFILAAEEIARERWPGERFYTYVNPRKVKSTNPGYCFIKAGWQRIGYTKSGLIILAKEYTK